MHIFRLVSTAICIAASSACWAAQATPESMGFTRQEAIAFYVVKGTCSAFSTNEEPPSKCDSILTVDVYMDGHYALRLTRGNLRLAFNVPSVAANAQTQVDGLIIGQAKGSASGTCRIGDPYRGSARFECEAHGVAGKAQIVFTSDGSKPVKVNI